MIRGRRFKTAILIVLVALLLVLLHYRASSKPGLCHESEVLQMLDSKPQPSLTRIARFLAFLTTPLKKLGISGWLQTGCTGRGTGKAIRDAQHSTDGFFTIDVVLTGLLIGQTLSTVAGRYIRLEVKPGTDAHVICTKRKVRANAMIRFEGEVLIDNDGPFLEIHPKTLGIEEDKPERRN